MKDIVKQIIRRWITIIKDSKNQISATSYKEVPGNIWESDGILNFRIEWYYKQNVEHGDAPTSEIVYPNRLTI